MINNSIKIKFKKENKEESVFIQFTPSQTLTTLPHQCPLLQPVHPLLKPELHMQPPTFYTLTTQLSV